MTSLQPTYTRFRCITCNTNPERIQELAPIKGTPIIDFHKDAGCQIEYFTNETYRAYLQSVTPDSNTNHSNVHKKKYSMKWFIHKARIINRMGFYFSRMDFPEISPSNFRGYVYDATKKGLIEMMVNAQIPSYRVIGELSDNKERGAVTLKRMGVGLEFEKILRDTCIAYPKIHDIRLKVKTEGLHEILSKSYPVNKSNSGIELDTVNLRPFIFATITAYPNTVEIVIACSRMSIIYDTHGALDFMLMLSEIREKLYCKTKYSSSVYIPSVLEWIVTQYHFNKDGHSMQYSGEHFEVKVKEMSGGMFRLYAKLFPDGITRVRQEQIRNPNTAVLDEIGKMIMTGNYVYNTSGIKLTSNEARQVLDIIPNLPIDDIQVPSTPSVIVVNGSSVFNPMQDRLYSF